MKILFLNTNIGYGGASKMMVWVANRYAKAGHEIIFLTYRGEEVCQKVSSTVKHVHVDLEPLSGRGNGLWGTVMYLRTYIKEHKFDLAVGFLSPSQLRLSLACIGTSTKLLFSHRGDPSQKASSLPMQIVGKFFETAFRRADRFVFQTRQAKECFSKSVQNRSDVIANPIIPLKRTMPRKDNIEKRIVMIARLDINQKRQDLLIESFKMVSETHPDYTLDLYGDGGDEAKLKEVAKSNTQIRFMGKTSNVIGVSQNAAMSVLSSDFEGIPNSLLESMSLGIPCVATDSSPGGAAMMIRNHENGLLVPRGDAKALAEAINYMIEHPEQAEAMGKQAMEVNTIYSEAKISQKWMEVLNKM